CVLSAKYPETERRAYPMSSPKPAIKPTIAALAPNEPRNGPTIPRAPSLSEISKEIYDADDEDEAERRSISHYPAINTRLRLCNFCVAGELTRTEAWKCRSTNVEVRGNGKVTKIEEMLRISPLVIWASSFY